MWVNAFLFYVSPCDSHKIKSHRRMRTGVQGSRLRAAAPGAGAPSDRSSISKALRGMHTGA